MSRIGNAYDSLVGVFSPKKALQNQYLRERMRQVKKIDKRRSEQYAAAKNTRMTGGWTPANTNVNEIIKSSAPSVRGRVRQLVRDMPYFANAVNRLVDYSVGAGITFQSHVLNADGDFDKKINQKIEDVVKFWMDECDVAKKLHFYEMQQLCKRQDVESGELVVVKRFRPREGRYLPYTLQIYEADWITDQHDTYLGPMAQKSGGSRFEVNQGVKHDRLTGEVISYFFTDPDGWGSAIEVPAKDVIHGFQHLRPFQMRGISPFTPGVLLANDLADYMDAEVDAAKMAAKYLAFVQSPDPADRQSLIEQDEDDPDKYIEDMETAIIEYLNPGEEIKIATNPRPGTQITPFTRLIVTMLSVVTSVPYELLSGDYQGMNYSTGRMVRNDFSHYLKPISGRHIRQFCQPAWWPVLDYAVAENKIDLPGFYNGSYRYKRNEWQPPGMESIDPLRETKAWVDAMTNNIRSPQEIIRARGRDPEEVLKERKQWNQWLIDYGVGAPEQTSTSLSGNPAAVQEQ